MRVNRRGIAPRAQAKSRTKRSKLAHARRGFRRFFALLHRDLQASAALDGQRGQGLVEERAQEGNFAGASVISPACAMRFIVATVSSARSSPRSRAR